MAILQSSAKPVWEKFAAPECWVCRWLLKLSPQCELHKVNAATSAGCSVETVLRLEDLNRGEWKEQNTLEFIHYCWQSLFLEACMRSMHENCKCVVTLSKLSFYSTFIWTHTKTHKVFSCKHIQTQTPHSHTTLIF